MNQTFGAWLGDQAKGLVVGLTFGGILVTAVDQVQWPRSSGTGWSEPSGDRRAVQVITGEH